MSDRSSAIVAPRQERSRQTLLRILDAFELALDVGTFEEVTVGDLCERAGCSVGAFYARVESKEALLEHLRDRMYAEAGQILAALFDPAQAACGELEGLIDRQASALVDLHVRRRGVIRAVVVEARRRTEFAVHTRPFNEALLRRVGETWLQRRHEISHSDPELAVEQAAIMAAGYLRETVVFSGLWPTTRSVEPGEVADCLRNMLVGFLMGPNRSA